VVQGKRASVITKDEVALGRLQFRWRQILLEMFPIARHEVVRTGRLSAFIKAIIGFVWGTGERAVTTVIRPEAARVNAATIIRRSMPRI